MTDRIVTAVDSFIAAHCSGLAAFLYKLDGDTVVLLTLALLLALVIGWNAFAHWYNRRFVEYFDAEWMEYDAWEATR